MKKTPRTKKCRNCGKSFNPFSSIAVACSPKCAIDLVEERKEKMSIKQSKLDRKATRERKQALKSKSDWLKECQTAFNAFIRARDVGNVCISCGKSKEELKINHIISMVCGHFLSVGAHGELRFNALNAHLQCTRCNGGAGKYGNFNNKELTVTQNYRARLIDKIGQAKVDWLEGPQQAHNLTVEDIKEIKQYYKEQIKYHKERIK